MAVSRETAIEILGMLSEGTPIIDACRLMGVTRSKLYVALDAEGLGDMHARAREEYAEARVAEMQRIAETVEDVGRAKLLCDNIKWEACRIAPKKYGDRIENRLADADGNALTVQVIRFGDNPTSS